jgi:hypothetical protein
LEAPQEIADGVERIAVGQTHSMSVGVPQRDAAILRRQDELRLGTEERVACPRLPTFDRLEQERVRTGTQSQIGRQRRVEIRGKLGKDRNEITPRGELAELVTGR